MDDHEQKRGPRFRQRSDGSAELNDGKDRGDGRTGFGTFPPGRSGNPNGRPRGALNAATIVREELSQRVTMIESGKRTSRSKFAASVAKLANLGLTKDSVRALERIIALGLSVEEKTEAKKVTPLNEADRAVLALLAERLGKVQAAAAPAGDDDRNGMDE